MDILQVFLLCGLFYLTESYPSGADPVSCVNLLPHHHGTAPQPLSEAPYTIYVNRKTYSPQTTLIVSVFGTPDFLAFLLQGQIKETGKPVGQFIRLAPNSKYLRCSENQDSVTHSNPTPRNISQFIWNPPKTDLGEIVFKGSVAQSKSRYYGVLESETITYVAPGTGSLAPGDTYRSGGSGQAAGSGASEILQTTTKLLAMLPLIGLLWFSN